MGKRGPLAACLCGETRASQVISGGAGRGRPLDGGSLDLFVWECTALTLLRPRALLPAKVYRHVWQLGPHRSAGTGRHWE